MSREEAVMKKYQQVKAMVDKEMQRVEKLKKEIEEYKVYMDKSFFSESSPFFKIAMAKAARPKNIKEDTQIDSIGNISVTVISVPEYMRLSFFKGGKRMLMVYCFDNGHVVVAVREKGGFELLKALTTKYKKQLAKLFTELTVLFSS